MTSFRDSGLKLLAVIRSPYPSLRIGFHVTGDNMIDQFNLENFTGVTHRTMAWVEEHPQIRSNIKERIRNVPEAIRERAFINAAKTEAMNQTVRPVGNPVRP